MIGSIAMLLATIYHFRLEALGWYFWHASKPQTEGHTLDLKNYQVEIDGLSIPGLENASGLTFDSERNSLFTVLNKESQIIELNIKGKVLRKVNVTGVDDMEGITHIAGNRYVIADERDNRLVEVSLDDQATQLDIKDAKKIKLGMNPAGNKNFEGVSWDDNHNRLLVAKERDPKYLMSVSGFFNVPADQPLNVEIKKIDAFDAAIKWSLRDLSSVTYYSETGHLLLLSDESRLIKEYDEDGKAIGALALWKGFHGLRQHVPQAEGIAIGSDGRIYIMSEPNLFYVFKPKKPFSPKAAT
ncbi:MAG TPA: SdiA-regulated domain-containing protein [Methylotenera sp.]|nr:SdiA-regulated domain-containing protein [Methylotenera sp.]